MRSERLMTLLHNPGSLRPFAQSLCSSFSQYGEDRLLSLLLNPSSTGTYIDVGSHHPYEGSNTYALYLRGWRGITIDPNPMFRESYRKWRPHEPHLVAAVSESSQPLTYFAFQNSLYNTLSEQRAAQLLEEGVVPVSEERIPTQPLRQIADQHLGGRHIDLLSVDCEGLDLEVIRSLDVTVNAPTVIIMEDFARLAMFRDGAGESDLHDFLFANGYVPIAQLAFSAIYVARNSRELMKRSDAFDPARIQGGILPE